MGHRVKWGIVSLITIGVAIYITYDLKNTDIVKVTKEAEVESTPESTAHQKLIVKAEGELDAAKEKGDKAKIQTAERNLAEVYGGRVGAMLNMSLDGMVEHTLHGRVFDQTDQPVEGATVLTMYGNSGFMQGYGDHRLTTDADGRFVSRGTGGGVTILNVLHPEITRFQNIYKTSANGIGYTPTLSLSSANNSPENPRILRVWRVESYADVVLFDPEWIYAAPTGESNTQHHLRVTCVRTPYKGYRTQPSTWAMKLETAEPGGFRRAEDTYLNKAPVDGYDTQEIEAAYEFGSEKFKKIHDFYDFYYFYYFKSGAHYGVFRLSAFKPFSRGDRCVVLFRMGRYNNEGTRDLAVSPKLEKW